MTESYDALLTQLARLRGLGDAYYDHRGELRYFSVAARRAILSAMNVPVENETTLRAAIEIELRATASFSPTSDTPQVCYQPPFLESQKSWGLSIQLYTLRSSRNWGIGDFGDLRELIELVAPLGCDVIGLNPLHALFVSDPRRCSPYSPSSRLFLNVLYLAMEAIPEFRECPSVQALWSQSTFQAKLADLRLADHVMYEQVATHKLSALRLLHNYFRETHIVPRSERGRVFEEFVADRGESLHLHAVFDALDTHFRERDIHGWRQWPIEYRDPHSRAVEEFAAMHKFEIEFFSFAQWLTSEQFASAQRCARERGMRIGLYGDLAVGADPDGSEVWSNQSLYVSGASVGAPPDPLALNGQDWGIPPIDPHELRAQKFRPFVELLRANMRHVGALRVDHVMSLFRLWWVPRGFGAVEGVYVHYPLHELVDYLAAESLRSRCLIIGEDLGTVPDEIRSAMERSRLYHYKVLLFEKRDGNFNPPQDYPPHSVAAVATHDLPPLKAWWQDDDLALRDRLGLYPNTDTAWLLHEERATDRYALLRALNREDLWHWQPHEPLPEFSPALARAIQMYLGKTEAALVLVQLEDLIGMTDPVNVPGTHEEHANWQRKLSMTTEAILAREDVRETLAALGKARAGVNPNN
jgi:4-alpha-glucanotransferase